MHIWLDTLDEDTIQLAEDLNILSGVTTNPRILAQSPLSIKATLDRLLQIQNGKITVQVTARAADEMIIQALAFSELSERIIVKVPATKEGLKTIKFLSMKQIPCMATMIFHPNQVLLAAAAGANYVAPYLSRMERLEENGWQYLESMAHIITLHQLPVQLLVASIKNSLQIMQCAELGVDAITIKKEAFEEFISDNKYTLDCEEEFMDEWKQSRHYNDPLFQVRK